MIQGRVVTDDSPTGEFTSGPGVSQLQCANDVSWIYIMLLIIKIVSAGTF